MKIVDGVVDDGRGRLPVVWFNQPWIDGRLADAGRVSLFGQLREQRSGAVQLVNPEVNDLDDDQSERILPMYGRLGPITGRRLRRLIERSLEVVDQCHDPLPAELLTELGLPSLGESLRQLHAPDLPADARHAASKVEALCRHDTAYHRRLAFDELLSFSCGMADHRSTRSRQAAPRCDTEKDGLQLAGSMLPFELTGAQRRVLGEIEHDLRAPHPMARLVQGDVGCGKTAVAALAMRLVLESDHQAALMAPTELLAEQHARSLAELFDGSPFDVNLLTSTAGDRSRVMGGLADGSVRLVVGTHALIQGAVEFAGLGLAVVDEQHRFGVSQREALLLKGRAPHLLVMTATPIPRTLALTLYGDLDVSVIDELPPGRMPVTTAVRHATDRQRVNEFLRREIAGGGRVFVVFPTIDSSEKTAAPALEDLAAGIAADLQPARVGMVHGRMPRDARESVTRAFRTGEIQVLLATTVVEVGVDVPEATVMVIHGADRFGLSQLHQLRGRVGRGQRQSWCILMADEGISDTARQRLEAMCATGDGFEIAETDLELRGPGELTGYRQWGPAGFRFADLLAHRDLVAAARQVARRLASHGSLGAVKGALRRYHPMSDHLPAG
jgi:ATP-dependent DNA helicase RecG